MSHRDALLDRFRPLMETNHDLNRQLVSFQANKDEPGYRWFKYREAFSKDLVRYMLRAHAPTPGKLLDPFAGAGTALFAARDMGWDVTGIELLPVGCRVIETRALLETIDLHDLETHASTILAGLDADGDPGTRIRHVPITRDAFPPATETLLNKYLARCRNVADPGVAKVLEFAALAILEDVSYTRKDGQYLRWDSRAPRDKLRSRFNKGEIKAFEDAVRGKLDELVHDARLAARTSGTTGPTPPLRIHQGSSLEILPSLPAASFDVVFTSPPYCNRYDYTRTYALELAMLGKDDDDFKTLRQQLLSCTVENKQKEAQVRQIYLAAGRNADLDRIFDAWSQSTAVREINDVMERLMAGKVLNNTGVPRMVRNYVLELSVTVFEMARLLRPGGCIIMVNDNVQYGGEEVPLDLVMSEFAERIGLIVERIHVLPRGKGNSSQQMGRHRRRELRKCVYAWRKPTTIEP